MDSHEPSSAGCFWPILLKNSSRPGVEGACCAEDFEIEGRGGALYRHSHYGLVCHLDCHRSLPIVWCVPSCRQRSRCTDVTISRLSDGDILNPDEQISRKGNGDLGDEEAQHSVEQYIAGWVVDRVLHSEV